MKVDLRITLNNRLATAAAAMVQRMMMRSMPRVFRPPSPFRKGSKPMVAMFGDENGLSGGRFKPLRKTDQSKMHFGSCKTSGISWHRLIRFSAFNSYR